MVLLRMLVKNASMVPLRMLVENASMVPLWILVRSASMVPLIMLVTSASMVLCRCPCILLHVWLESRWSACLYCSMACKG